MGTISATRSEVASDNSQLVEMNWDPITRIGGRPLGILYRNLTSASAKVASSAAVLLRSSAGTAFSRRAKRESAGRSLYYEPHLRHLREQPRHLCHLRAEHGVRRATSGHSPNGL